MDSTEKKLHKFFTNRLVPAAEHLQQRGVSFFPLKADSADSWYVEPPDIDGIIDIDDCDFAKHLREMWQKQDYPELADLAEPLQTLALELELKDEQNEDISPFIYVMY